jgi:hypothetical protein
MVAVAAVVDWSAMASFGNIKDFDNAVDVDDDAGWGESPKAGGAMAAPVPVDNQDGACWDEEAWLVRIPALLPGAAGKFSDGDGLPNENNDAPAGGVLVKGMLDDEGGVGPPFQVSRLLPAIISTLPVVVGKVLLGVWRDGVRTFVIAAAVFVNDAAGMGGLNSNFSDMAFRRTTFGRGALIHRFRRSWNKARSVFVLSIPGGGDDEDDS